MCGLVGEALVSHQACSRGLPLVILFFLSPSSTHNLGLLWYFFFFQGKSLHSPFSQDHNLPQLLPRFEIQVPALVFSAGCRLPPGMRRSPASGHLCLGHHPGRHLPTCPGPITHVFVEATCIGVCMQTSVGRIELLGVGPLVDACMSVCAVSLLVGSGSEKESF